MRPELAALPPALVARGYYLSATVCPKGHTYEGTGWCLRRKSNHGCCLCNQAWDVARRPARAHRHALGDRPALPRHLADACFLSPILCANPAHRYKGDQWTLRFVDSEMCTMCVAQTRRLAGD